MPPPRLDLQTLSPPDCDNLVAGLGALTSERNLPQQFMNGFMTNAMKVLRFFKKPQQFINGAMINAKKLLEFLKKPEQAIDGLVENAKKLLEFLKKPRKSEIESLDTQAN